MALCFPMGHLSCLVYICTYQYNHLPLFICHKSFVLVQSDQLLNVITFSRSYSKVVVYLYRHRHSSEGIVLILVIQTFYPSTLSVLYNKDVYPTSSTVWFTTFLLIYLNHIRLHKTLSYLSYSLCFFTLLILKFIYIYVHYVFIYYYYYHVLGGLNISFY